MLTVAPRIPSGIFGESTNAEAYKVLPGEDRPVKDVMTQEMVTINAAVTVKEARRVIQDHNVLTLIVCLENEPVLALTEYDLAIMTIAEGCSDSTTLNEFLKQRTGVRCHENAILADAIRTMTNHRVRHAPVVNARGKLIGVLSMGDAIGAISPHAAAHWLTTMRRKWTEAPEFM